MVTAAKTKRNVSKKKSVPSRVKNPQEQAVVQYREPVGSALMDAEKLEVVDFGQVMEAADELLKVKLIGEQITLKKEEITRPQNEALKAARAIFKPLEDQAARAERIIKDKVLDWHEREWKKGQQTDNTISGLKGHVTITARHRVEISDEKAIPPQFCSPDPKKVEHALKAGIEVPGATLVETYDISAGKN